MKIYFQNYFQPVGEAITLIAPDGSANKVRSDHQSLILQKMITYRYLICDRRGHF